MEEEMICDICGTECYRQRFRVGEGWKSRHEKCEPDKPIEHKRRYKRGSGGLIPMSYGGTSFDPAIGRAIEGSRK